ncbi:MAG: helix-turn-helix domain-containing protein [Chlamydiales bacterium]
MINLDQLHTFYYIASYRNLSDAANFLKMDKSSASRQLRSLEIFLKRPLIIRSSQGLIPTSFWVLFVRKN